MWREKGDSMTKEFFNAMKESPPRATITELLTPDGNTISRHQDIEEACLSFYRDLYTSPGSQDQTRQVAHAILESIPTCITPLMSLELSKPISEQELHRATCELAKDKAPGPDGTIVNFFACFWLLIGADYCRMVQDSLHTGRFPKGVTKGLITLIPKSGDRKLLNNWRPITLLNVSYKIYAKALQL